MAMSCRAVLRSEAWQEIPLNQIALEAELKTQLRAYKLPLTVSVCGRLFPPDAPCIATVVATHNYAPNNADELRLCEGDEVSVIEQPDGGWWKGEVDGQHGWFPANHSAPATPVHNAVPSPAPPAAFC